MNINPIFKYSFALRILSTPLLYFTRNSIPYTVLLLIALDIIDYRSKKGAEHNYIVLDKLIDIFQYCIAIYFLSPMLPLKIIHILMGFTLMRLIGVFHHSLNKDPLMFVIFFDFIKEYLLLFYIYYPNFTIGLLIETMIVKIIFEYYMHKKAIFSTLYELILD